MNEVRNFTYEDLRQELDNLVPCNQESFKLEVLEAGRVGHACMCMISRAIDDFFKSRWHDLPLEMHRTFGYNLGASHWKDVHITWRHAYTIISYLKVLVEYSLCRVNDDLDLRNRG